MTTVLLTLALAIGAPSVSDGTAPLRVLTYNIHHGEGADRKIDLERIASIIREAHPDVVCLQEVDQGLSRTARVDMPEILGRLLKMEVVYGPNYRFDDERYGNATLSRFPIVSHENHPLPTPAGQEQRGCLRTTIRVGGRTVDVFNAHFGLTAEQRKEQASFVAGLLGDGPSVVAGDLNETPGGPALNILTALLRDTFVESGSNAHRIDYVLVSADLDVLSSRVLSAPPADRASDHMPYAADLRLGAAPRGAEVQGIYDADDQRVNEAVGEE